MPHPTDGGVVESWAAARPLDRSPSHAQILFRRSEILGPTLRQPVRCEAAGARWFAQTFSQAFAAVPALSGIHWAICPDTMAAKTVADLGAANVGLNYLSGSEAYRHG